MTDREMTAAAAEACGLTVTWNEDLNAHTIDMGNGQQPEAWEPLIDTLACDYVQHRLNITLRSMPTRVSPDNPEVTYSGESTAQALFHSARELHGSDAASASRRAVVRVASMIREAAVLAAQMAVE